MAAAIRVAAVVPGGGGCSVFILLCTVNHNQTRTSLQDDKQTIRASALSSKVCPEENLQYSWLLRLVAGSSVVSVVWRDYSSPILSQDDQSRANALKIECYRSASA